MRLLIHDFVGHPFQVELSRNLARRGHSILHVYCASLRTTPQGNLVRHPDDPALFTVEGLTVAGYDRENLFARWQGDHRYGRRLVEVVRRFQPDVILSANAPLDAQAMLQQAAHRAHIPVVYWLQDLIGEASYRLLRRRLLPVGRLIGRHYQRLERRLLRQSAAIVSITEDFRPVLQQIGLPDARIHTIENWSPLDDLPVRPQDNPWSRAHDFANKTVVLYAGTLGMKHNPALLLELGRRFRNHRDVYVVVCSQGKGADWLRDQARAEHLDNVQVLGFQPFESLPDVLGSASLLTAILEPDAGVFSVPSKVLSYFCAARPLLLAVPPENLSARLVLREQAGSVVSPDDAHTFADAAAELLGNSQRRATASANARSYAEQAFAIDPITDRFELILRAVGSR